MKIVKVSTQILLLLLVSFYLNAQSRSYKHQKRPNILFCIADDASWQHMSAYKQGNSEWVQTPNFDRVANGGLLFNKAYTPNAKCSPSRSIILTGRNSWQLEEAANHVPFFPSKFTTFVEALGADGYFTGFTGKGWAPGDPGRYIDGTRRMLTGKEYNSVKVKSVPALGISKTDYGANFKEFLKEKPEDQPFFFWYGGHEPHRGYEYKSGIEKGRKKISDIREVAPFWIDNDVTRTDMLDYAFEVEYFDQKLGEILDILEDAGELDHTFIVVTSDNGMPFPRVKGHLFEYDNHLPLAIMYKNKIDRPGREINDLISFTDFAPTFLELSGTSEKESKMQPIQGKSFLGLILKEKNMPDYQTRDFILLGREREDVGRPHDQGYPSRAIIAGDFMLSRNYEPDRWPSGNPETGYLDTDGSPTKTEIINANRKGDAPRVWELSFGKRPMFELYNIKKDPYSIHNLAYNPLYEYIGDSLLIQMESELRKQGDPRMFGRGYIFDDYPYSKAIRRNFYERYMNGEDIEFPTSNKSNAEKLRK